MISTINGHAVSNTVWRSLEHIAAFTIIGEIDGYKIAKKMRSLLLLTREGEIDLVLVEATIDGLHFDGPVRVCRALGLTAG